MRLRFMAMPRHPDQSHGRDPRAGGCLGLGAPTPARLRSGRTSRSIHPPLGSSLYGGRLGYCLGRTWSRADSASGRHEFSAHAPLTKLGVLQA